MLLSSAGVSPPSQRPSAASTVMQNKDLTGSVFYVSAPLRNKYTVDILQKGNNASGRLRFFEYTGKGDVAVSTLAGDCMGVSIQGTEWGYGVAADCPMRFGL